MRKIKHWSGYGCVKAKKMIDFGTHVDVMVMGEHEQGLEPRYFNTGDWMRWLGDRFHIEDVDHVKAVTTYYPTEAMMVTFYRKEG